MRKNICHFIDYAILVLLNDQWTFWLRECLENERPFHVLEYEVTMMVKSTFSRNTNSCSYSSHLPIASIPKLFIASINVELKTNRSVLFWSTVNKIFSINSTFDCDQNISRQISKLNPNVWRLIIFIVSTKTWKEEADVVEVWTNHLLSSLRIRKMFEIKETTRCTFARFTVVNQWA